jgi:hypothetical protein
MTGRRAILVAALATAAAPAAYAHHGWSSFDTGRVLDMSGKVVSSTYANPHGLLRLMRDGQQITIELAPTSRMRARGLEAADIAPGRVVRVYAYPSTVDTHVFRAEWVEVDGRRVELR